MNEVLQIRPDLAVVTRISFQIALLTCRTRPKALITQTMSQTTTQPLPYGASSCELAEPSLHQARL